MEEFKGEKGLVYSPNKGNEDIFDEEFNPLEVAKTSRALAKEFADKIKNPIKKGEVIVSEDMVDTFDNWFNRVCFIMSDAPTQWDRETQDAVHDMNIALNPVNSALRGQSEYGFLLNKGTNGLEEVLTWPSLVLERTARHLNRESRRENLNIGKQIEFVGKFFSCLLVGRGKNPVKVSVDKNLPSLRGDQIDFLSALMNPVRNSQRRIESGVGQNITISARRDEKGSVIIEILDDAGGFDEKSGQLKEVRIKNSKDQDIITQNVFARGVTIGGSGYGLDITRRDIEDEYEGSKVRASNRPFPGTNKIGAVVTFEIPVK